MHVYATLIGFLLVMLTGILPAQSFRDRPNEIEIMDPNTMYSFRGWDGRGFLRRSPVNLPEPAYAGDETGLVALQFVITPSGQVSDVKLENSPVTMANEDMILAAKNAVLSWKFNPLPADEPQDDDEVRVVIQFNFPYAAVRYSDEGMCEIRDLGVREPIALPAPAYETDHEGTVTVQLTIGPDGKVAWVDKYYGETPDAAVQPRLGIITSEAVKNWRFSVLPEEHSQSYKLITVVLHYFRRPNEDEVATEELPE